LEELSIKLYIVEEKYDGEFLRRISQILGKRIGKIYPIKGKPKMFSPKLLRVIENNVVVYECDEFVIVVDGDGNPKETIKRLNVVIPQKYKSRVKFIVFEKEIEEWITISLGINVPEFMKPSEALNDYLRNHKGESYDKCMLPEFVEVLDFNKLRKLETFKKFEETLED